MKKTLLLICFLFLSHLVVSQMYVSPSSYVFVNNQYVYITSDLNLQNTSNFYLRNQSQLLQGSTGTSTNFGPGELSVFQEGTVNNFQYNYWCSPVGTPSALFGNEPFSITRFYRPTGLTSSSAAIILNGGGANLNGTASPLAISSYWIWKFVTSNTYAQWIGVGSAANINAGEGFTMKGTSGTDTTIAQTAEGVTNNSGSNQRYDFRGKPNDGTITTAVSSGNFTLVGNPYPSAIDLNAFLLSPANSTRINGQAYFWEQVPVNSHNIAQYQGGYGVYNPSTGIYTPATFYNYDGSGSQNGTTGGSGAAIERRFSPVGQGFMVLGTSAGVVTMQNSFRLYRKEGAAFNSQFAKMNSDTKTFSEEYYEDIPNLAGIDYTKVKKGPAPHLRIDAMYNNGGIRPTTISFLDTATDGFDYGADGRSPSSENAEFYYIVQDSPYEYVATCVQFDENKKIPIGFRCTEPTVLNVQLKDMYNLDSNLNVYLHDKNSGIYYDIKNTDFTMNMPSGEDKNRFEITFKNYDGNLSQESTTVVNDFTVYQNNTNNSLTVLNPKSYDVNTILVYDVSGKMVISKSKVGKATQYEIPTSNLSDGVYIVKLTTKNSIVIDKKVSISKN